MAQTRSGSRNKATQAQAQAQAPAEVEVRTKGEVETTGGEPDTSAPQETAGQQPEPEEQAKPKAAAKPAGPSAYRVRYGTSDAGIVAAVRAHAKAHYEDGGWDTVVEAWDDAQILDAIGWATSAAGAIRKVAAVVSVIADREADLRADAENAAKE